MLLAVNFHYISEAPRAGSRAIFPITVAAFEAQLDELAKTWEFVSRDDLVSAVRGDRSLPARACVITFDDGLREQFELGLPVLEARGIPAIFFVCGEPLERTRVLPVHRIHHLREHFPDGELLAALEAEIDDLQLVTDEVAQAMYRYDTAEAAKLKYLLNVVIGPTRPDAVGHLFAARVDEVELWERLYMPPEQVVELEGKGMLGSHTYGHMPLSVLSSDEARADVDRGLETLRSLTGARALTFSYPWGTASAVDARAAADVAACGFVLAFTTERTLNRTLEQPLLLARVDTNDAPGGKRPLFKVEGEDIVTTEGTTTSFRARYFDEMAA
jgi:peptidoglycan/xylan/chitin deacetylase (PgdA/CDA1 family)